MDNLLYQNHANKLFRPLLLWSCHFTNLIPPIYYDYDSVMIRWILDRFQNERNVMCYDAFIFKIYCYESVFHRMKIFFFFFPFEITKKIFYIIRNKSVLSKLCILLEFIKWFKRFERLWKLIFIKSTVTNYRQIKILRFYFFAQMKFYKKKKKKKKILDALRIKSLCCSGKFNWNIG